MKNNIILFFDNIFSNQLLLNCFIIIQNNQNKLHQQ